MRERRGLGPQASVALTLVRRDEALIVREQYPLPPDWEPLGMTPAAREHMQALEVERLRDRVLELEHALRRAEAEKAEAVEQARRAERARYARTQGGRLSSILTLRG